MNCKENATHVLLIARYQGDHNLQLKSMEAVIINMMRCDYAHVAMFLLINCGTVVPLLNLILFSPTEWPHFKVNRRRYNG